MSDLVGREVSKTMLDAYTSESKEGHRLPAELLPAFCEATGDRLLESREAGGVFTFVIEKRA